MITADRAVLLERGGQLAILRELYEGTRSGKGAVAFVKGEAGAGKTALVRAFADSIPGGRLLIGACDGVSTPRPLGPVHDMASQLGPDVARLIARGTSDGASSHQQLFEQLLTDLRNGGPSMVVIEDLHWSDHATLDLLRYLGRRIADTAALMVGTYRDDQLGPFDPVRLVLGDLATLSWTRQIDVPPLSAVAVAQLLRGRPIDAERLHELTGGNAFFVSEVLASGDDGAVPETARDAVRARVARLSDRGRRALQAAAVLGTRVEPWLLAAVSGEDLPGVDESLGAGLLVRDDESLAFRHELSRMTVIEDLPLIQAIGLHRRALRSLVRARDVDPARLAYHAEGAADGVAVIRHARAAAERAVALRAHAEAIAQLRRVLKFGTSLPTTERADILERISYELFLTNHLAESYETRVEALRLREAVGDQVRTGDDLRYLSRVAWFTGRGAEAWEHARAAVEVLEPLGPTLELAMAWGNLSHLYMIDQQHEPAVAWGHRALELARRLGDPEAIAYALNNIGSAELAAGSEDGRAKLLESLQIAKRHTMQEHIDRALFNLGETDLAFHRYADAERHLVECLEYTMSCDLERCQLLADAGRAAARLELGRWNEAEEMAASVIVHPRVSPHGKVHALATLARLAMRRGQAGVDSMLEEAASLAEAAGGLSYLGMVASATAERAWLAGTPAEAAAAAGAALPLAIERGDTWVIGELAAWVWRAGALKAVPPNAAEPFALELAANPLAAAQAWDRIGNPYHASICRAQSDDPAVVRSAHDGLVALGATAAAEVVARRLRQLGAPVPRGPRSATRANPSQLTPREAEIATLLAEGLTTADIARRLVITEKTVGHHVSAVLGKLGVRRRAEVASALARASAAPR